MIRSSLKAIRDSRRRPGFRGGFRLKETFGFKMTLGFEKAFWFKTKFGG